MGRCFKYNGLSINYVREFSFMQLQKIKQKSIITRLYGVRQADVVAGY